MSRVRLEGPEGSLDAAVKWNRWRGARGALSDRMHGSRAARALAGAARLDACGVRTPEPLARAERRRGGWVVESFLLTCFEGGAEPLAAVLPGLAGSPRRRRVLVAAVGDLVGRLHAAGLDHRDLKHSNLLVGPGDRLALLDLDALSARRGLSWRRRVRALGQLEAFACDLYPWLPRSDRARFLGAYLRHHPGLAPRRRELVADVRAWVGRRLADWAKKDRSGHKRFPLAPRRAAAPPGPPPAAHSTKRISR